MSLQQLSQLFDQAVELASDEQRTAFVEKHCGNDAGLRKELESLLRAHFRGNRVLEDPTHAMEVVASSSSDDEEGEGSLVGNYKLLQKIGEGGMGVVFMADQLRPIRRKVAVKIIREGVRSKQIIARFEAEREALARLDHPNVTRILDAGVTPSGRSFFAMELVKGSHITHYCNTHQVPIRERLELLEKVCMVIHHAHQKGILHRDIKPSNVMITLHDGVPVPKVIDFGIAKALDRPLTEQTLFTRYGDLIGTPEYMSPEQAEMSGLDLDVRTDIYSLGVLLYELLTGSTPLTSDQIQGKGLLKIFETIRDSEAELPSLRVTRTLSAHETVNDRWKTNAISHRKSIAGELDWITMKAIAKDRNERYESAAAMAKDIRRHLEGEPIEAAAPTFAYRARKFYQKHRSVTLVASSCALLLILSTALSVYWAIHSSMQSARLRASSEELASQKEVAESALARALVAEKRAEVLARNERLKATRSKVRANEMLKRIESALVKSGGPDTHRKATGLPTSIALASGDIPDSVRSREIGKVTHGVIQGSVSMKLPDTSFEDIQIFASEPARTPGIGLNATSMVKIEKVVQKLPPSYHSALVEEIRKDFGNTDPFVAVALCDLASSLCEEAKPESFVEAENHLREAMSILESISDQGIGRARVWIQLGKVLKAQGKLVQAEPIMAKAQEWLTSNPQAVGEDEKEALKELQREFDLIQKDQSKSDDETKSVGN